MKRTILVAAIASMLCGCVNGYAKFYHQLPGVTPQLVSSRRAEPPPSVPRLDHSGQTAQQVVDAYARFAYYPIGYSSFNGGGSPPDSDAVSQGKKLGADVVVILSPHYTGTTSTVIPIVTPNTSTSYSTGSATAYGPGGTATAYGSSTTTTYGNTTNLIPVSTARYDFEAIYFIKSKTYFGASVRELDDAERQRYGTNRGVVVTNVVNDSPAFNADIVPGDLILTINGDRLSATDFGRLLKGLSGQTVTIVGMHNNEKFSKSVTLNR